MNPCKTDDLHIFTPKTLVHHLGKPVPPSLNTTFKTRGWFQGYKTFFLEAWLDFQNSPCNLGLFEELVLAEIVFNIQNGFLPTDQTTPLQI